MTIPEHIKQKIREQYPTGMDNVLYLSRGAVYGYSLAQEEMSQSLRLYECQNNTIIKQQEEIERLKSANAYLQKQLLT